MSKSSVTVTTYAWRGWLYMLLQPVLGGIYAGLMCAGFAAGFGLSVVWIGLPILSLMFIATRKVAALDRRFAAYMMGMELADLPEDLDASNINPLAYVGAHLASAVTWQQVVYLFLKVPLGMVSFLLAVMVAPFLFFETLLGVFGLNIGHITPKIVRAMAAGLSGTSGALLPAAVQATTHVDVPTRRPMQTKTKNKLTLYELEPTESDEVEYFIDDDGEIGVYYKH